MNRFIRNLVVGPTVVLSGACAPLQQAPLVYSSKVAVGVDLSSNATENPGISITLGVKTVDVAYVPVAVSKEVDAKSANGTATPEILPIFAQYGQGSTDGDTKNLTDAKKQKINAYIDARKAAVDATTLQTSEDAKLAELKRQQAAIALAIKTLDTLGAQPPQPVPTAAAAAMSPASADAALDVATAAANTKRDDAIQKTLNPQLLDIKDPEILAMPKGTLDLSSLRSRLATKLVEKDSALPIQAKASEAARNDAAEKTARANDLFQQAAQAASLLQTSKTDAMSVFGRFDSTSSATAPATGASGAAAGLLIGKVFSTGLASQNLTEAAKISAVAGCISNGLVAAGAASAAGTVSGSDRSAMVVALSAACSATPTK